MRNLSHILSYMLLLLLYSCYTATESTPRIGEAEVGKIEKTEEEQVMEKHFAQQGCHTWLPGKRFAYVDDALSPVLRPEKGALLVDAGLRGKTFTYEGYREENLYGDKALVTLVFRCDSLLYDYATGKTMAEITASGYVPLIPSFVDMDYVGTAGSLFVGKKLYILTNLWYDANGELFAGRKFVPVTVTSVDPGNNVLPLALAFTDERGVTGRVFMSVKSSAHTQMLTFDRLFSYGNPRDAHKEITDDVWTAITHARLLKGMTKEECKLAIGLPAEVRKIPTYSGLKEQWIYNTGAYLLFSDGVLDSFRQ